MHGVYLSDLFHNLLHLGTPDSAAFPVSVIEKIIRPIVIYALLVTALRLWGKRMLAQLNPFDLVVLLTLANTVQNAIIGNDTSLAGGIVGAATLLAVNHLAVRLFYRGPTRDAAVESGGAICLINHGQPVEAVMTQLRINMGELTAKAHERGFESLGEIEEATLYPNGTLSFVPRHAATAERRHEEVMRQLGGLQREVAALARLQG